MTTHFLSISIHNLCQTKLVIVVQKTDTLAKLLSAGFWRRKIGGGFG